MEEKKISIMEMLEMTAKMIEEIQVPVAYADQISRPLCHALYNLKMCIEAAKNPEEPDEGQEVEKDGAC